MSREGAVRLLAGHGWSVARTTKRGCLIMRCACGKHQETLHMTVGVAVDVREELDALVRGVSAIKAAFARAGVGTTRLPVLRDVQSRVLPLQAA